jgi:hypothetical protein
MPDRKLRTPLSGLAGSNGNDAAEQQRHDKKQHPIRSHGFFLTG